MAIGGSGEGSHLHPPAFPCLWEEDGVQAVKQEALQECQPCSWGLKHECWHEEEQM